MISGGCSLGKEELAWRVELSGLGDGEVFGNQVQ